LENEELKKAVKQLQSNLKSQTERSSINEKTAFKYKEQLEKKDKTESNLSDLQHKLSKATSETMIIKEEKHKLRDKIDIIDKEKSVYSHNVPKSKRPQVKTSPILVKTSPV